MKLLNQEYQIIKNEKDGFVLEEIEKIITDYFTDYDYILGDWAYGKLRLKGFCKNNNPKFKELNDYQNIDNYLKNYCAFGCKYFIIEKKS